MLTVWYTEPSGVDLPNPTAGQMLQFMQRDEEYWGPYSPMGVLCWHEHADQPAPSRVGLGTATEREQLLFVRHSERGWYFEYSTFNRSPRRCLVSAAAGGDFERYVKHRAHGEQMHFLAGCFVPQAAAERVVAEFLAAHGPSDAVSWQSFETLLPRLDPSAYRERRKRTKGK
jgi:hypothetical protein